jgi:6-pyruvoyl-tetrahydropterin synthase
MPSVKSGFSIHVTKENLKFSAAHFIAYPGFREPLHGHNYQVGVRVEGRLAASGYVLDFGLIKKLTKQIADRLDERTIVPANSDCLTIERSGNELTVRYGLDRFAFPVSDVAILPIAHSSVEELAHYIWKEVHDALRAQNALSGIISIEISVAEGPGQAAIYREEITKD